MSGAARLVPFMGWPDQVIEAKVDEVIAVDKRTLPRWGWKTPGPYNGATGPERIAGWQKVQIARLRGWLPWPSACLICGWTKHLHDHTENYARPMFVKAICRSCHNLLHRRFSHRENWAALLMLHPDTWASSLPLVELTRIQLLRRASLSDPVADAQRSPC